MRTLVAAAIAAVALFTGPLARAQYTPSAGTSAPAEARSETYKDEEGREKTRIVRVAPSRDGYGNARGNQFDLAVDGAFKGQTVLVLQFYTLESNFDFALPRAALAEKGFSVVRYTNGAPSPRELKKALAKSNQLWIIGSDRKFLSDQHLAVIREFWNRGHGIYIWGDNQPYYEDTNFVAKALLGVTMSGNVMGDQTVGMLKSRKRAGVLKNHLLSTGLEYLYEGITIATIADSQVLTPLIYGSAENLVAGFYDKHGRRAIVDGGFTRLYNKWDTAGTARYVKNAAAWLANVERHPIAKVAR
jgi:hypothetical protein